MSWNSNLYNIYNTYSLLCTVSIEICDFQVDIVSDIYIDPMYTIHSHYIFQLYICILVILVNIWQNWRLASQKDDTAVLL